MLGCQDFCGYYEWTFHFLRRKFGSAALEKYWAQAVAADGQRHYIAAAQAHGLRGLYESWLKTGVDEQCDWAVTFEEKQNLLRLDMQQCPSKGFLLAHSLNADEDYCDHCIGWIGPALQQASVEVTAHEHNHCGQCWWEIRKQEMAQPPVEVSCDIRRDARWGRGYVDRYERGVRLSPNGSGEPADSCEVLARWFADASTLVVFGPVDRTAESPGRADDSAPAIISGARFATGNLPAGRVRGVMLEHDPVLLPAVSQQYRQCAQPPVLMHPFLPGLPMLDFAEAGLPRAVPILPLLIRTGLYEHRTVGTFLEPWEFAALVATALDKQVIHAGFERQEESHIELPERMR